VAGETVTRNKAPAAPDIKREADQRDRLRRDVNVGLHSRCGRHNGIMRSEMCVVCTSDWNSCVTAHRYYN